MTTVARKVAEVLVGSRRTRFGPRPSADNMGHLVQLIQWHVDAGTPVPFLVNWCGAKCYSLRPPGAADIFDLMAIERLNDLRQGVLEHHRPGVDCMLVFEDWTEERLTGNACQHYALTLARMIRAAGATHVNMVSERDLIPDGLAERAKDNAAALLAGDFGAVGWKGSIDWPFYLQRARSEHPHEHDDQLRVRVTSYLGIALARYQLKVFPTERVRLSFCPYPPTAPDSLRRLRVEWKAKPSGNSNKTTPPWAGFGCVRPCGERTHISVNQARSCKTWQGETERYGIKVPFLWLDH